MNRSGIIVLVEDNPDEVELALRAFRKNQITNEILVLRDGQEAVDWFFSGDPKSLRPDVVLLDLKLPRLDGVEVLRRLRADERTKRLPIIMFTSSSQESDMNACYDLGANGFVRKPVVFTALVEVLQRLGSFWLEANEPPAAYRAVK